MTILLVLINRKDRVCRFLYSILILRWIRPACFLTWYPCWLPLFLKSESLLGWADITQMINLYLFIISGGLAGLSLFLHKDLVKLIYLPVNCRPTMTLILSLSLSLHFYICFYNFLNKTFATHQYNLFTINAGIFMHTHYWRETALLGVLKMQIKIIPLFFYANRIINIQYLVRFLYR